MNNLKKYGITTVTLIFTALFIYLFTNIIVYLIIAVVLALMGAPCMKLLSKIKFKSKKIPTSISAAITLMAMYCALFLLFYLFIPLIFKELKFLGTLNFSEVLHSIFQEFPKIKNLATNFGTEEQIKLSIFSETEKLLNFNNFSQLLNNVASTTGTFLGGLLAVSFITYFLMKEENMVYNFVLLITPSQFTNAIIDVLKTTRVMLTNYFTGLFLDMIIVTTLVFVGMYFCGVKNALFIGVFAGVMNIIPYIGPLISIVFAMFLGITGCFENNAIQELPNVMSKIAVVMLVVNLIDGLLIQPLIFAKSVKAHPLEIFLVILMAATLGGVIGMVVAIPTYTLLRIIAKEFFSHLKFFKKITENIPE